VHYEFVVPEDQAEPLTIEVKLQYRKFDTIYMNYVFNTNYVKGAPFTVTNDLPITTIAADKITFPIEGVELDNTQLSTLNSQPFPSGNVGMITALACSSKATSVRRKAS
jgi:hypothetical protein